MNRNFFLKTERIGFSEWNKADLGLAETLWGDPKVTKYICADGIFSKEDILNRLYTEITSNAQAGVQYRPIFELATQE